MGRNTPPSGSLAARVDRANGSAAIVCTVEGIYRTVDDDYVPAWRLVSARSAEVFGTLDG